MAFQGLGWGEHGTIWAEAKMGAPSIMAYRELLEDTFGPYLTDSRFHTHLSVFKNVEATPQEKARFKASNMYHSIPNQLGDGDLKREEDPRGGIETALEGGPDRKGVNPRNQEV